MKKILAFGALLPAAVLTSCSININGIGTDADFKFTDKNSENVRIETDGIDKIDVKVDVGQCKVSYGESETADITGNYTVHGLNEKKVSAALENIKLTHEIKGDTLYVKVQTPNGSKNFINYTTDLEIILPTNFSDFKISSDVGDIELDGLSGNFDISADVGEIDLDSLSGNFDITADVGDIDADNITLTGDSKIEADVGNIDVSLTETAECELEIIADVGDIDVDTNGLDYTEIDKSEDYTGEKVKLVINDKCSAELKADVGNIKIKK